MYLTEEARHKYAEFVRKVEGTGEGWACAGDHETAPNNWASWSYRDHEITLVAVYICSFSTARNIGIWPWEARKVKRTPIKAQECAYQPRHFEANYVTKLAVLT